MRRGRTRPLTPRSSRPPPPPGVRTPTRRGRTRLLTPGRAGGARRRSVRQPDLLPDTPDHVDPNQGPGRGQRAAARFISNNGRPDRTSRIRTNEDDPFGPARPAATPPRLPVSRKRPRRAHGRHSVGHSPAAGGGSRAARRACPPPGPPRRPGQDGPPHALGRWPALGVKPSNSAGHLAPEPDSGTVRRRSRRSTCACPVSPG